MSDKEIQIIADTIRKNAKKATSTEGENDIFLKKIGVLTKNGNASRAYKKLCIPTEQD
jgi:hypothetical protein